MPGVTPLIEICVEGADAVELAAQCGADRAELCADLTEGGITPSAGTIREARRRAPRIGLMVMIRPRGGDFHYSEAELASMQHDVAVAKDLGADGVVLGLLRTDGTVDRERTAALVAAARPMQVTFHRAFDLTPDPRQALEELIALSVDRVLTSGQKDCAADAIPLLRDLVTLAGARIRVMPGGGLTRDSILETLRLTGASEVHFAALATAPSPMIFRRPGVSMGAGRIPGEYERKLTDPLELREMVRVLRGR